MCVWGLIAENSAVKLTKWLLLPLTIKWYTTSWQLVEKTITTKSLLAWKRRTTTILGRVATFYTRTKPLLATRTCLWATLALSLKAISKVDSTSCRTWKLWVHLFQSQKESSRLLNVNAEWVTSLKVVTGKVWSLKTSKLILTMFKWTAGSIIKMQIRVRLSKLR